MTEWYLKLKFNRGKFAAWAIGNKLNFEFLGSFPNKPEAEQAFELFMARTI